MDAGDSSDPYCKIALGKDVSRNGRNTQITCQKPHGNCKKNTLELKLDGILVEEKKVAKYLGVYIDNKLNWKTHIAHVKTKL